MVRERASRVVRRIKEMVGVGSYRLTDHALEEMDDEGIVDGDVVSAVVTGTLERRQSHDPRGVRYVIRGRSLAGRDMEVVCRLVGPKVRIITVYLVQ